MKCKCGHLKGSHTDNGTGTITSCRRVRPIKCGCKQFEENYSSQGELTPSDSRASGGATVRLGGSVVSDEDKEPEVCAGNTQGTSGSTIPIELKVTSANARRDIK